MKLSSTTQVGVSFLVVVIAVLGSFRQAKPFTPEPASTTTISVAIGAYEPISTPSSIAPGLAVPAAERTGHEISTPSSAAPGLATPPELPCIDLSPDCAAWQALGECVHNAVYMQVHCAAACGSCAAQDAELRAARVMAAADVAAVPKCRDKTAECTQWASIGECDRNPTYMRISCAASCDSCEWADPNRRCRKDPDAIQAVPPGEIGALFRAIEAGEVGTEYGARIVSRPPQPWVAVFDRFIEPAHADEIVALANSDDGARFQPSMGTDGIDEHGQLVPTLSTYRTSSTYWCEADCLNTSAVVRLRGKVATLTRVPDANHEYPQLLRYYESQEYKVHSDYIPEHRPMPCGPRVYTAFVYLSDVEAGGQTSFPELGLAVTPKKGRMVLWPSVHDERPMDVDERTKHIANPVERGVKMSVNFWLHQHDFKANHRIGCTG